MWNGRETGSDWGMEAALDSMHGRMRQLAEIEQQRAELAVSAAMADGSVTVTVNADGHLTDLEFSADISSFSYTEIAAAVVETTRLAVFEVGRRSAELLAPLNDSNAQMPDLSELMEGFLDIELPPMRREVPEEPPAVDSDIVRVAGADDGSVVSAHPDEEAPVMEFDDAMDLAEVSSEADSSEVADRGWE